MSKGKQETGKRNNNQRNSNSKRRNTNQRNSSQRNNDQRNTNQRRVNQKSSKETTKERSSQNENRARRLEGNKSQTVTLRRADDRALTFSYPASANRGILPMLQSPIVSSSPA